MVIQPLSLAIKTNPLVDGNVRCKMLEPLLGSVNAERCLLFILAREEGYASEIAQFFDTDLYGVQRQLDKLEAGGVLASYRAGRTRLYRFNPRYSFLRELVALLEKALRFYPPDEQDRLRIVRRRPRRKGKPL
jgi:predicted transcriptional regulator